MQDKQKELEDQCKADDGLDVGDPCPKCGSPLVLRQSSHGEFLGCSDFPSCKFVQYSHFKHSVMTLLRLDAPCPQCGSPLEVKKGRYGMYIGCSDYENCNFIYSEAEKTLITCPVCKKGKLIERSSKTGRRFFGCSNYPECGFSVLGEPVESVCIHCGFPLKFKKKIKDGRIVLKCGNPVCSSRRSRKYEFFVEEKVG